MREEGIEYRTRSITYFVYAMTDVQWQKEALLHIVYTTIRTKKNSTAQHRTAHVRLLHLHACMQQTISAYDGHTFNAYAFSKYNR